MFLRQKYCKVPIGARPHLPIGFHLALMQLQTSRSFGFKLNVCCVTRRVFKIEHSIQFELNLQIWSTVCVDAFCVCFVCKLYTFHFVFILVVVGENVLTYNFIFTLWLILCCIPSLSTFTCPSYFVSFPSAIVRTCLRTYTAAWVLWCRSTHIVFKSTVEVAKGNMIFSKEMVSVLRI